MWKGFIFIAFIRHCIFQVIHLVLWQADTIASTFSSFFIIFLCQTLLQLSNCSYLEEHRWKRLQSQFDNVFFDHMVQFKIHFIFNIYWETGFWKDMHFGFCSHHISQPYYYYTPLLYHSCTVGFLQWWHFYRSWQFLN